ncbi:hypothetical protein [Bosea massiliensis]|uniref:Uncharacterized protein n=1 Tax=Bosea massiliensis TaxID=151419 RepID=A0ABW0P9J7_9HYPH
MPTFPSFDHRQAMSRKNEFNRAYIEESVTDFDHPYRRGRASSQDDDFEGGEITGSIRDVEAEAGENDWTPRRLEQRLIEGAKVMHVTVSRVGPSGARGFWPESYPIFQDEFDRLQRVYPNETTGRAKLQATSAQIARADQALAWPKRYVANLHVLKVLNAWIASKAMRRSWAGVVKERGWSLATADRCRDRAKAEIIQGLRRDGVSFS